MNLYLVEIGDGHFKYEPLSTTLNISILNRSLAKKGTYPILNNNDYRLIKECGGSVVMFGKVVDEQKVRVWIINIDHVQTYLGSVEFTETIYQIILSVKRDLKLSHITN
jgi:hypothetical protein